MDNYIFGHESFWIKDSRLFGIDTSLHPKATIVDGPGPNCTNCSMSPVTICNTYTVCGECLAFRPGGGEDPCCNQQTFFICTTYWTDAEGGTGGGGSQGSGGSGGGSWWTNPCETQSGGRIGPCSGNLGWEPVIEDSVPVPGDSLLAIRLKRMYEKALNMPDSLFNIALQDGDERTFTFNLSGPNDTVAAYPKRGNSLSSQPELFPYSIGVWHCHQDDGPNDPYKNQSFDGPDIYKMYKNRTIDSYPVDVSFITTRDYIYAAVITDAIKFRNYIRSICGTSELVTLYNNLNNMHINTMDSCSGFGCTWQKKSEWGTMRITANNNSSESGIKIFRSPRNNINFTLLTY